MRRVGNVRKAIGQVSKSGHDWKTNMHGQKVEYDRHTGHDVAGIHGVLVLNEAEAIHKLNLGNLARAMGVEMILNIGLGSCSNTVQSAMPEDPKPAPSQLPLQGVSSKRWRVSLSQS